MFYNTKNFSFNFRFLVQYIRTKPTANQAIWDTKDLKGGNNSVCNRLLYKDEVLYKLLCSVLVSAFYNRFVLPVFYSGAGTVFYMHINIVPVFYIDAVSIFFIGFVPVLTSIFAYVFLGGVFYNDSVCIFALLSVFRINPCSACSFRGC